MRKIFLALLALAFAAGCTQQASEALPSSVGPRACWSPDKCISLEIVSTPEAMQRGLMFRETLNKDAGMLFPYAQPGYPAIWMKNMRFPLDLLWLDAKGKIVWTQGNVPPCTAEPCAIYAPQAVSSYVLEVNAGFTRENGLKTGKELRLDLGLGLLSDE